MRTRAMLAILVTAVVAAAATGAGESDLRIRAIQHRDWWELRYADGTVAANELHVPIGRRVTIHAALDGVGVLWFDDGHMPRIGSSATVTLHESQPATIIARALHFDRPRRSRLTIIADPEFDTWLAHQKAAVSPKAANPFVARGRDVFLTARCTLCHTVRGLAVAEQPVAPDLTHVASRSTIAAGTVPNRPGYLAGWVVDPDNLKPHSGMPVNNVPSTDLQALLAFLETLR